MAAPTEAMVAGLLALLLAACSSPPTAGSATKTPAAAPEPVAAPSPDPTSPPAPGHAQVDAGELPADVREYILKQRMCRHFSRAEAEGGNPAMAASTCAGADETAWKALVRKYRDDDAIASVLLAERPAAAAERQ